MDVDNTNDHMIQMNYQTCVFGSPAKFVNTTQKRIQIATQKNVCGGFRFLSAGVMCSKFDKNGTCDQLFNCSSVKCVRDSVLAGVIDNVSKCAN